MLFPRAIPLLLLILSIIPCFTGQDLQNHNQIKIDKSNSGGGDDKDECVYALYVKTGNKNGAGTDSMVSLTLAGDDAQNGVLPIKNLEAWGGLMGSNYNYFEKGNLDIFSGRGPCLSSAPCQMNLTTDGTGLLSAWFCDYVEVTATSPHGPCSQQFFSVQQWIDDKTPFAIRDYCTEPAPPRRIAA